MKEYRPSAKRALRLLLVLGVLTPVLIALWWGDIYSDTAYRQLDRAQAVFSGVDRSTKGFAPLFVLALAAVSRWPGAALAVALGISLLGWMLAIATWFWIGLSLGQPMFSAVSVLLLALHPLQPQVFALETGLLLGLWGLVTLCALQRRTAAMSIALVALVAIRPVMLAFAAPLLIGSQIWRRSAPTLAHVFLAVAGGAVGLGLAALLGWVSRDARLWALLLASLQLLFAAGFAILVPRLDWLVRPVPRRGALQRGIVSLALLGLIVGQSSRLLQDWQMRSVDRLTMYQAVARWLRDHTLPGETVGTQSGGLVAYLSERDTLALPETTRPSSLLMALERTHPDYCVASDSMAWYGVRSQGWFQQRYQQVFQASSPYDSASPITVFRHIPLPFEVGQTITVTARFTPDTKEWIELESYRLDQRRITPGEPLHLTLNWRPTTAIHQLLYLVVRLTDSETGEVWARTENFAPGGLATDLWNAEARLTDQYVLMAPPDLPSGDYVLDVALYQRNDDTQPVYSGQRGEAMRREPLRLAQLYQPPSVSTSPPTPDHLVSLAFGDEIELIGYDLPERVAPGDRLRVALYWHALQPARTGYKVFIHLFDLSDQLVAQDDSVPVNWTYPTTSWQPGEYIRDEHLLLMDPSLARGDYTLYVGLYDAVTGERVVVRDAQRNAIPERRLLLQLVQVR